MPTTGKTCTQLFTVTFFKVRFPLLISLFFCLPWSIVAQNSTWFVRSIPKDAGQILISPKNIQQSWKPVLILGGAIGVAFIADEWAQKQWNSTEANPLPVADIFSPYTVSATAGILALGGHLFNHEQSEKMGLLMGTALFHTAWITASSKLIAGRTRPSYANGIDRWNGLSWCDVQHSFISAHSSFIWALGGTYLQASQPKWWKYGLVFGIGSVTSISRITANKHYLSDVVVGGVIGYAVGKYIAKRHRDSKWSLFPNFSSSGFELSYALHF